MPKHRFLHVTVLVILALLLAVPGATAQGPLGTSFTYQGHLVQNSIPVNSACDFEFSLFDSATGTTQIGSNVTKSNVAVTNGLFTALLDFGDGAINGNERHLEIALRCPADPTDTSPFSALSPRQELTATPQALALPGLFTQSNAISPNLIGGYSGNSVASGVNGATIGGGGERFFENRVTGNFGTVGGGHRNTASGSFVATVGGGSGNNASGEGSTVGGGNVNTAGIFAFVGGGAGNTASGLEPTIGGGGNNTASGAFATIGGGRGNEATVDFATIAGGGRSDPTVAGSVNRVTDDYGTVSGGGDNQAGDADADPTTATFATVGGGLSNIASGGQSTIGGGVGNTASDESSTVGGGDGNTASSDQSTIGGGFDNTASGFAATVPGGRSNTAAGDKSFAAGFNAKIAPTHDGTFLFADASGLAFSGPDFNSLTANEFAVRAVGGTRFVSAIDGAGNPTAGVQLPSGGGAWSAISDRNSKANFASVDGRDILERLSEVPIEMWNYKSQDPSIRHIGPMAQDVYGAFGVGEDNKHISTIDADGVALSAIQGLYQIVQQKDTQIAALEERLAALEDASVGNSASAGLLSFGAPTTPTMWLLFGGLSLGILVLGQRWLAGGRR